VTDLPHDATNDDLLKLFKDVRVLLPAASMALILDTVWQRKGGKNYAVSRCFNSNRGIS
jgi:hypothetical protein